MLYIHTHNGFSHCLVSTSSYTDLWPHDQLHVGSLLFHCQTIVILSKRVLIYLSIDLSMFVRCWKQLQQLGSCRLVQRICQQRMTRLWVYVIYSPVQSTGVINMSAHYDLSACFENISPTLAYEIVQRQPITLPTCFVVCYSQQSVRIHFSPGSIIYKFISQINADHNNIKKHKLQATDTSHTIFMQFSQKYD